MPARSLIKRPYPVTIVVPFGDESVTVVFDRNAMTQNWIQGVQDGQQADDLTITSRALSEILLEWDLVEEDGSPTPIAAEILADLPLPFLRKLDEMIGDAALPTSEEGNASSAILPIPSTVSLPTPESLQNGPEPSPSPVPSASPSPT